MIPDLLTITAVACASLYLIYRVLTWKPTMLTNSNDDPDAGDVCGHCCISLISVFIILLIGLIFLFAYIGV